MTLRQLEYLLEVVRQGSFTAAATALHVSQPTLSQQVRALEAEVGGPLLWRDRGPVRPTPAGKALLGHAQASVSSARRALENARRAVNAEPRALTLATVRSLASAVLPETLTRWHEQRPDVSIRLQEFASRVQVADAVAAGEADLGVGPLPPDWPGARIELGWEQLVLVLPSGDPLAHGEHDLTLDALAGREWVFYDEGHGLGEQALKACRAAGFEPQIAVRTAQVEAAARLAVAGLGPALVPIKNVGAELTPHVRGIDPPVAWRVWAYVAADELSDLTAEFTRVLVEGPWQRRARQ
ncbi:MAG TPA: LysR family transcriptional regulator [Solirubrobacter sp.]|nr:LysR family transcriptional regulator [Solirubrobacter sp.]